jgi:hypothetical protein
MFFGALGLTAFSTAYAARRALCTNRPPPSLGEPIQTQNSAELPGESGHVRSSLREIGVPVLVGLGLALAAGALHARIFGRAVLPKYDAGERGENFSEHASRF